MRSYRNLCLAFALAFLAAAQLSAATMFVVLSDPIRSENGPAQDTAAARLQSLGASQIRRYTALNMLRADIPESALTTLLLDPAIAAIVPAGNNAAWIDRIEYHLTSTTDTRLDPGTAIQDGSDAFAALIDRIATERDFAIFSAGEFPSANTIRATDLIRALLPLLDGVSRSRHLALKALATLGTPQASVHADTLSTAPGGGFRFYRIPPGASLTALAWDRHFTRGIQSYRRDLRMSLYDAAQGSLVIGASAADAVLKVKLLDSAGAPQGDEDYALAVSTPTLAPAEGPVLRVRCLHLDAVLNCTVSNNGDLPVFAARAHLGQSDQALGGIAPGGSASFSVPATGPDSQSPFGLAVEADAYGEVIRAAVVAPAVGAPPDPPQLILSCQVTAGGLTCTTNNPGQVDVNSVTITAAGAGGGFFQQVPVGTVAAGGSAQATFPATFLGLIGASGTADQPVSSNTLAFTALNQPPVQHSAPSCTGEAALGDGQPYSGHGGFGSIAIKTQPGCFTQMWTDGAGVPGLATLDTAGGTGSRTATLTMNPNATPDASTSPRGGNLQLKITAFFVNRLIPVTQAGLTCNFQPSLTPQPAPMNGGAGTLNMSVDSDCQWTAHADPLGPVLIQYPSPYVGYSNGPGSLAVFFAPNSSGADRSFTMTAGGQTITGLQRGSDCAYTASASGSLSFDSSGGSGGINITGSPSTCASSISSTAGWLSFTGGITAGAGNWSPAFSATANTKLNGSTTSRTAGLTVTGASSGSTPFSQSFSVTQAGLTCAFTLPSTPFSVPATGIPATHPQSFTVGVSSSVCQWTATSGTSLIHIVNDGVTQSGNTAYTVQYWADANPGTTQIAAVIHAGDQIYNGNILGDGLITILDPAKDGMDFLAGDGFVLTWMSNKLKGSDHVKITLTPTGTGDINPNMPAVTSTVEKGMATVFMPPVTLAGAAGTLQHYTVTLIDTDVTGVSDTRNINVAFPVITVSEPNSKSVISRKNPGIVQWTIKPAGAKIGTLGIYFLAPNSQTPILVKKGIADSTVEYNLTPGSLVHVGPGSGYRIRVASDSQTTQKPPSPRWSGDSDQFAIEGIDITSPGLMAEVQRSLTGDLLVVYDYWGNSQTADFVVQSNGKEVGKASGVSIGGNGTGKQVHIQLNAAAIGLLSVTATANDASHDQDAVDFLLIGIANIAGSVAKNGSIDITWDDAGGNTIGKTCTVEVLQGSTTLASATGVSTTAKQATLRPASALKPGTYTIRITTFTASNQAGYQAVGALVVK